MRTILLAAALIAGCAAPQIVPGGRDSRSPVLESDQVLMPDGYRLPLRVWSGQREPSAVLLGLHGFNDYGRSLGPLGEALAPKGIMTYAIDQRGFGATRLPGRWHGAERLAEDLRTLIGLLRGRHPHARLYVAGESMGGAVIMLAAAQAPLPIDGLILIAPAVWSRDSMPWYQRAALSLAAHTLPALRLTGEGIRLSPTDNQALLRAMSRDPLVIKATRVDALWGITELMDAARLAAPQLPTPTLLLYGERDEIIPRKAFCRILGRLPARDPGLRLVLYRSGWHMLPRDLAGARVRADIAAWIADPSGPLPSGEETPLIGKRIQTFCSDS